MVTPMGIVLVVFGVMVCFAGYSIFQSMLPLWGFILAGFIAAVIGPMIVANPPVQPMVFQIIVFLAGGVIGAVLAKPLYFVTIFASGAAAGALIGMVLGAYLSISGGQASLHALTELAGLSFPPPVTTVLQTVLMVVLGGVLGGCSILFQKFMISASTAFLGSAAVISGLTGAIGQTLQAATTRSVVIFTAWLVLGLVGMFIQFRMRDEV